MFVSATAFAEPENSASAKEAYEHGLAAHARGDHKQAAQDFARADALAPNATALQAALDAAIEADDAALGNELLDRSKREPPPPNLAASITAAHLKFSGRAPSSPQPADAARTADAAHGRGLAPIFFYAGLGLTAVLGGVTTYFALDAANKHAAFGDAGCARADFPSCRDLKSDGESSQKAANIGLVLTTVTGVATVAIGALITNWRGPVVAVHPGGGEATWRVTF